MGLVQNCIDQSRVEQKTILKGGQNYHALSEEETYKRTKTLRAAEAILGALPRGLL
jgi:hypothetical protein